LNSDEEKGLQDGNCKMLGKSTTLWDETKERKGGGFGKKTWGESKSRK